MAGARENWPFDMRPSATRVLVRFAMALLLTTQACSVRAVDSEALLRRRLTELGGSSSCFEPILVRLNEAEIDTIRRFLADEFQVDVTLSAYLNEVVVDLYQCIDMDRL